MARHFPEDIFKCIFFNEDVLISNKISLKLIPKGPINNIPVLVEIMVWRWPGNKPLSGSMVINLLTYKCVTLENEDVLGAVLTGDAPTTSEWSTIIW